MNNNLMKAKDGYSLQGDSTEQSPILDGRLSRYSSVFDESDEAAWDMCFVVRLDGTLDSEVAELWKRGVKGSVSEVTQDQKAHEALALQQRMNNVGLETKEYLSVQNDEIYVLVRVPEDVLEVEAEASEVDVECRPEMLEVYGREMQARFPGESVNNFSVPSFELLKSEHQDTSSLLGPYEHMWMPFKRDPRFADLYVRHYKSAGEYSKDGAMGDTCFTTVQRLKILHALLERPEVDGGCGVDDAVLQANGWSIFPLHTHHERTTLHGCWLQRRAIWLGWLQPLDRSFGQPFSLKDYLGERVSLYFAFLGTHCRWLFVLGLLGLVVQVIVVVEHDPAHPAVALFAVVVAVWGALFTQHWKRREALLGLQWGMSSFEGKEGVRLKFKQNNPVKKHDVVTGQLNYKYPGTKEKLGRRLVSAAITGFALLIIMAIMVTVYWLKVQMLHSRSAFVSNNASTLFSIILAVSISVINVSYVTTAERLAEYENHRTETSYRDSKVMISSFGGLTYTAFFEHDYEGNCGVGVSCMGVISKLVATILVERFLFTILFDNVLPQVNAAKRFQKETAGIDSSKFSPAEAQFILDPYDLKREILNRYMDQVIMFGYMCLFVCAFPVAPFLGYISNILQIQQFGYSMLFRKQRNIPVGTQDIGSFQNCFETVSLLAIVTNTGLVFFTNQKKYFGDDFDQKLILWLFFGTMALIFAVVNVVKQVVSEVPEMVEIQLRRQEFIKGELFDDDLIKKDENKDVEASRRPKARAPGL